MPFRVEQQVVDTTARGENYLGTFTMESDGDLTLTITLGDDKVTLGNPAITALLRFLQSQLS